MKILQNDMQEDCTLNTPIQQNKGTDSRTNMSDNKPDFVSKGDTSRNMTMRKSKNSIMAG